PRGAWSGRGRAPPPAPAGATASTPSESSTAAAPPHPPRTTAPGAGGTGPAPARLPGGQGPRRYAPRVSVHRFRTGDDTFRVAIDAMSRAALRPDFTWREIPAPSRMAPSAWAATGEIEDRKSVG